ncbi:SAICAR synthetase [mine drainage metagenome]|uniref:phosphoribosylaminoimidazolesuccinocarboxamide synthase n=1 Tax=mine drainage metagenome TaxID=410659 RepID=T0ZXQ8_9ZZZZ
MDAQAVYRTSLRGLEKIHEGKVRDIYAAGPDAMLIVTTDRLSAFDVVLPDPIPGKGRMLDQISQFWFERTRHIVPNHLAGRQIESLVTDPASGPCWRGARSSFDASRRCRSRRWCAAT